MNLIRVLTAWVLNVVIANGITGENMDESPETRKPVGEASGSNQTELNEVSWQKWINKGKVQDIARRKKFHLALCFLVPAGILLGFWALALRP